ncbi:MAG: TonB-dependent receptor [Arachidicoccus sp.]|nr:TonB-dependent receptor [Arachidicoccus sp.]
MKYSLKDLRQVSLQGSFIRFIKTIAIVIFVLCSAFVSARSQNVTISADNISLIEVFKQIKQQVGYGFVYTQPDAAIMKNVTIRLKKVPLKTALDSIFSKQMLSYTIQNNSIIVKTISQNLPSASQIIISGTITNKSGDKLVGVSIQIVGKKLGTISDSNGAFQIQAGSGDVLRFNSVGYQSKDIKINGETNLNVVLEESNTSLNDIVVIGYGTQQRKDVTGAISSINEKTLREVPVTNMQQSLAGRIAGLVVTQSDNRPGAQPSVLIRGNRSIQGGNDPLYVIDGIPTTDGLQDINPSDVVSMDVLKDASATAIYGSRGANGVIIVTTARGKQTQSGYPEIHYDTYVGTKRINRYAYVFNGPEFVNFVRDAYAATGNYDPSDSATSDAKIFDPETLVDIQKNEYSDWQKLITRNGFTQNHELSVLGASRTTRYSVGLGFYNDIGNIKLQDYKRYSLHATLDQDITKDVKVGLSVLASYNIQNGGGFNPFYGAVIQSPIGVPYDSTGNLVAFPNGDALMYNPLVYYRKDKYINKTTRTRILTSIYAEAHIWDGLRFRVNFGPDLTNSRTGNFDGTGDLQDILPTAGYSTDNIFSYTLENILTYNKNFGKNKLDVTGLYSLQQRTEEASSESVKDLPVSTVTYYNLGTANTITGVSSSYSKWDILSYMGRINYGFDNRYLLTLTVRSDGSSRFADGHKWGIFPSAAFAWNIYNENFLKNSDIISNLKLRLSYGRTGNTAISPYQTQGLLAQTKYTFADVSAFGYAPSSIANPNLTWETTASYNIGIDYGLFKDRINGSFEAYKSHTSDLLLGFALPTSTGFSTVLTNIGSTQNTGFEATIATRNIIANKKGGFEWNSTITAAFDKEKILELSGGKEDDVADLRFIGQALNVYYDYKKIGIWQTGQSDSAIKYSSSVGQIRVADLNGDGVINASDRTLLGQKNPKWTFGFNNTFNYKNFDLNIFIVAQTGNMIADYFRSVTNNSIALGGRYNGIKVDYWTPSNPTNAYPQPIAGQSGSPGPLYGSTLKYFNGSFLRIKNVSVGYRFDEGWIKKIRAQSLRIYFNVTNPYIFSSFVHKYHGIDPENTSEPAFINYLLGVNLSF